MHKATKKRMIFAGKSLVWGTLLFSIVMILLNWNDIRGSVTGKYVIITNTQDTIIHRIGTAGLDPIQTFVDKARTTLKSISGSLPSTQSN